MKNNLIIRGLKEKEGEKCQTTAENFMKKELKLTEVPTIRNAHWMGQGKSRPMLVALKDSSEKGLIYGKVSNLKDKKNEDDKAYNIIDQMPEVHNEEQSRYRQIMAANKKLITNKQMMEIKKGKLLINGVKYKKKINPITVNNIRGSRSSGPVARGHLKCCPGHQSWGVSGPEWSPTFSVNPFSTSLQ